MKIRAIRLAEVGPFATPVAIEGLTGGLDVLSAPNEAGKSTILRALAAALGSPHTSNHASIKDLKSYGGGAPLVEIDLDLGGTRVRLRKRFLGEKTALLTDLDSGQVTRGGDVQPRLDQLLGVTRANGFGLLFVHQGQPVAAMRPSADLHASLMSAVSAEVAAAADGNALARVRQAGKAALADIVTAHGVPRPTGRYLTATKARDAARAEADDAATRARIAGERLTALGDIRRTQAILGDPASVAARADAVRQAGERLDQARAAREKLKAAELALQAATTASAHSRERLTALDRALAELAALVQAQAAGAVEASRDDVGRAGAEAKAAGATRARESAGAALDLIDAEIQRAQAFEARQRRNAAREAEVDVASLDARLAGFNVTPALADQARREATSILALETQLTAAAPRVAIMHIPGATSRMRAEGRVLADNETFSPTALLTIEIDGVGRIQVTPGGGADADELRADLAAHRLCLDDVLAAADANSAEHAGQLERDRQALVQQRGAAVERLRMLAPDGIAQLDAAVPAAPLGDGVAPAMPLAELAGQRQALHKALAHAERAAEAAAQALAAIRETAASRGARLVATAERIAAMAAVLPAAADRQGRRAQLAAEAAADDTAHNTALRSRDAWREAAPDGAASASLETALAGAAATEATATRELARLQTDAARLEGELTAARDEDAEARAAAAFEALAVREAHVAGIETERDALQLLDAELALAEAGQADELVRPVLDRIGPYLSLVWPRARLRLGPDLAPAGLQRGADQNAAEPLARLSGGTQEQLALLARLGIARLLADSGDPLPLILDDALVYSDDARIDAMFRALEQASTAHQVIVLTCRARTFAPLAGHRLAITPWAGP